MWKQGDRLVKVRDIRSDGYFCRDKNFPIGSCIVFDEYLNKQDSFYTLDKSGYFYNVNWEKHGIYNWMRDNET